MSSENLQRSPDLSPSRLPDRDYPHRDVLTRPEADSVPRMGIVGWVVILAAYACVVLGGMVLMTAFTEFWLRHFTF